MLNIIQCEAKVLSLKVIFLQLITEHWVLKESFYG